MWLACFYTYPLRGNSARSALAGQGAAAEAAARSRACIALCYTRLVLNARPPLGRAAALLATGLTAGQRAPSAGWHTSGPGRGPALPVPRPMCNRGRRLLR
jgi:hypothetical protein